MNQQALKAHLKNIAENKKIPFNSAWKQLLLERLLIRIANSQHASKFVFKGGFLLAYRMEIGRETTDLDFLLTRMTIEEPLIQEIFENVSSTPNKDGFTFSFKNMEELTQPHMNYPGYRVNLAASFGKMKDSVHVDIGIGDVVTPESRKLPLCQYKNEPLFETELTMLTYPLETIFAEKLETIISKGAGNSRMKDYHDLFLLINNQERLNLEKLTQSIQTTFDHRNTTLEAISYNEKQISTLQALWKSHREDLGDIASSLNIPENIEKIIHKINLFLEKIRS